LKNQRSVLAKGMSFSTFFCQSRKKGGAKKLHLRPVLHVRKSDALASKGAINAQPKMAA
jgi:hypothetical protein